MDEPHKKTAKRRFLSARTCAVKHLSRCVLARCSVSRRPRPPLIICQVSKKKKKKGGFELHRMAERLGPSSSCVKPESRQADKMWNSWWGQEGKFQTNIRTCGGSRVCVCVCRGGFLNRFHVPGPPKKKHTYFCWRDFFFPSLNNSMWVCFSPGVCVCVFGFYFPPLKLALLFYFDSW